LTFHARVPHFSYGRHHGQPIHEFMIEAESSLRSRAFLPWALTCLALCLFFGLLVAKRSGLRRRLATVQIDKTGTARLGGVVPLRNTKVGDVALWAVKYLNGGKIAIVVDKGASWSSVVQVMESFSSAKTNFGTRAVTPPLGPIGGDEK
jgi:hypothetical protein